MLEAAVARQKATQVLAFAGGFQFAEEVADVLSRIDFIVPATLDSGVHEGIVRIPDVHL